MNTDSIFSSNDARQSPMWARFMRNIGWDVERVNEFNIFIKRIPWLHCSLIKIQHPKGPISFKKIDRIAKKYNALFLVLEPHPYGYREHQYKANGYEISKYRYAHSKTIKMDLRRSEKDLWGSFSENARRNIKKSQKNNITLKMIKLTDKNIDMYNDLFFKLLTQLSKMKKFYVSPIDEHHKRIAAFKNSSFFLFAYEKDVPIAVVWYGYFENVLVYLQTGITPRGYELLANYLLVWEGLKIGIKKRLKIFDFETIYDERYPQDHPSWKGYTEFKKRFHGVVVTYPPSYIKLYNPVITIIYRLATLFVK